MMYGNSSTGFSFSPDRSRDVDRFNPSTKANYSTNYNTRGCGCYTPNIAKKSGKGHYLGNGQYVED